MYKLANWTSTGFIRVCVLNCTKILGYSEIILKCHSFWQNSRKSVKVVLLCPCSFVYCYFLLTKMLWHGLVVLLIKRNNLNTVGVSDKRHNTTVSEIMSCLKLAINVLEKSQEVLEFGRHQGVQSLKLLLSNSLVLCR